MSLTTPSDQLVSTLLARTHAGRTSWEPANVLRTAFIAQRPSGTVTIELGPFGGPGAELAARDSQGRVIERIGPMSGVRGLAALRGPTIAAAAGDAELASLVTQQHQQNDSRIRQLASDFAK